MKAYKTMRDRFIGIMKNQSRYEGLELMVIEVIDSVDEPKGKVYNLQEDVGFYHHSGIWYDDFEELMKSRDVSRPINPEDYEGQ